MKLSDKGMEHKKFNLTLFGMFYVHLTQAKIILNKEISN